MKKSLVFLIGTITALPTVCLAQHSLPDNVEQKIILSCSEHLGTPLHKVCQDENQTAYISWDKFVTDPEFEDISEIVLKCSVDWPSYMMRVECVSSETKALVRMNNLVNVHGIPINTISQAAQSCSDFEDMGYAVLEICIRKKIVSITKKPLP